MTGEYYLLSVQDELNGKIITWVYVIEEPRYLSCFNNQSHHIHDDKDIVHYLIFISEDVIDILSSVKSSIDYCG